MEHPPSRRLILGIAAAAVLAGLCAAALWSARLHFQPAPVPVAVIPVPDRSQMAENRRLRTEIARLSAERDAALAQLHAAGPSGVPAGAAVSQPVEPQPRRRAPAVPAGPAPAGGPFTEPQTFGSATSTQ